METPQLAAAREMEPVVVTVPENASEGDEVPVDFGGQVSHVKIPTGLNPGDTFVLTQPPPSIPVTVATPVPSDQDLARDIQRIEDQHLDAIEIGFGAGQPHLTATEQKLLNYQWSIKCFAIVDTLGTVITLLFSSWGLLSLIFVLGPLCGYIGAKKLNYLHISIYFVFCILKSVYDLALFVITREVLCLVVMAVQIWVTSIVYKFWKLLGTLSLQRAFELSLLAYTATTTRFVYY